MARVFAGEDLPFAAVSPHLSVRALANAQLSHQDKMVLDLDSRGRLRTEDGLARLVRSLPLARDFHSCTLLLERGGGGVEEEEETTVFLQTSRPVRSGEPLYLWFSTDLQARLGISFLSPNNIRGEKNYVCHYCGDSFEYPNPLKLHMALDCERTELPGLWTRLWEVLRYADSPRDSASSSPEMKCPDSPSSSCSGSPPPTDLSWRRSVSAPLPPPSSAFRPYKQRDLLHPHHHPAARIEQLVSSLGQSKQGHLCLYCGKVYSRKYGLKIHIRTHTGFKPLKCKYCLRPFGDPSNLNKHVRLHSESDTPYRCELCGKMLVRKRDLERHMNSRHNIIN